MARTALLTAVAGAIIAANWLRLEQPRTDGWRAALLVALAVAVAIVRPLWRRVVAAAIASFAAVAVAFSVSPTRLWPDGAGFFGRVANRFGSGFLDFYDFRLPIDPVEHRRMHMVLLVALFAFTLAVGLAVAARRPVLAVALFLVGAGWPATLLTGGNELGRGAVLLAGALALLAGVSGRAGRLAVPVAAAVVLGALALSSSPAVAKSAFLDWQHWDFYNRPAKPVSVEYVWSTDFQPLHFPKKATTVLRVAGPRTPMYWRATVLERFAGDRWLEQIRPETPAETHEVVPRAARDLRNAVRQDITVEALSDRHLVGGMLPVAYNMSEPVRYVGQSVALVPGGLKRGERYTIWSYAASPTPAQLVRIPGAYPTALTAPGRELEVAPGVEARPFGTPGGDRELAARLTGRLEPYRLLLSRARRVAGQTRSPYAAVVALETWFRATGGFTYSERPGTTPGVPPLVGFVTDTKTGYCQHFAGAMALMLRMLGIPARVGAGFISGTLEDGRWNVTDHDAHTWVEVWFRDYGWLPFDPTPNRGHLSQSYSASSRTFNRAAAARLLNRIVSNGEVFGSGGRFAGPLAFDPNVRTPRSAADVGVRGLGPLPETGSSHSLLAFLALIAAGLGAAIVLAKVIRRQLRYATRDPRRIAVACGRELADYLADQRVTTPPGATLNELADTLASELSVDARPFADAAVAARFGRPDGAREAARRARFELRNLKRRLRTRIFLLDRVRGLFSLRSLGFS
jgi:Transglutaminase-like superfamily/TgpA N-terminal domain